MHVHGTCRGRANYWAAARRTTVGFVVIARVGGALPPTLATRARLFMEPYGARGVDCCVCMLCSFRWFVLN